jgi:hypothetical protein
VTARALSQAVVGAGLVIVLDRNSALLLNVTGQEVVPQPDLLDLVPHRFNC